MSSGNTTVFMSDSLHWPLCSRYFLVTLEALHIRVVEDGVAGDRALRWALGMLGDGQAEVLGVWTDPSIYVPPRQALWGSLKVRGVEKIRFVSSSNSSALFAALHHIFPGATSLPAGCQLETALPSRYRRRVRVIAESVSLLQRRTARAISRHGCFSDPSNAAAFVMDALTRGEYSRQVTGIGGHAVPEHLYGASELSE